MIKKCRFSDHKPLTTKSEENRRAYRNSNPGPDLNFELAMTDHLKSAPVAYDNEAFLHSPDGRIIRMLAEYQEPLARFRREQIQDTVVFFGSARVHSRESA